MQLALQRPGERPSLRHMRRADPYPLHRSFVARAASGGRSLLAVATVFIVFELVFAATPLILGEAAVMPPVSLDGEAPQVSPRDTLLEFGIFVVPFITLLLLVRILHRRGFWSMVGDAARARADLKAVFPWVFAVLLLPQLLWIWIDWDDFALIRPLDTWLFWLLPGVAVLLVQVATEELYFRGYLQQQLALRSTSRWVWMGVPSVLFGLAHLVNSPDLTEGTLWAIWAGLLGLACADLTARTGSLGAAIGLHLGNNAIVLFVIGTEGWPGSGLAMFLYPHVPFGAGALAGDGDPALMTGQIVGSAFNVWIMWMAARVAIRR